MDTQAVGAAFLAFEAKVFCSAKGGFWPTAAQT
jgi:hypothetical protein